MSYKHVEAPNEELKEEIKKENKLFRRSHVFTHVKNDLYEDTVKAVVPGPFVVDDSCFCPMSEAIKQLGRINDPSSGQLVEVYDFPNGKDNGKQLPVTRRRDFHDIAEYSQEIKNETSKMNKEILKGQIEKAEKEAFKKELEAISVSSKGSETTGE